MDTTSARSTPGARRLAKMPLREVAGIEVPVAASFAVRFFGLAHLDHEQAGPGLLIPRCRSVHTFGMRFDLDVWFLDREGAPLVIRRAVPPRRLLWCPAASAVLEVVPGGESSGSGT